MESEVRVVAFMDHVAPYVIKHINCRPESKPRHEILRVIGERTTESILITPIEEGFKESPHIGPRLAFAPKTIVKLCNVFCAHHQE